MKKVVTDIQMRFADVDCLGHVNNVNLQHYFDVGIMEFYSTVLGKTVDRNSESLILASVFTNYYRQTRLTDKVCVETWVRRVGGKSITVFQRLVDKATGAVNADCTKVAVGFDFERQETFRLRDEWRAKLAEYLETDSEE